MRQGEDDGLRLLALSRLGALVSPLARETLENAVLEVEPDVLAWSGTLGMVHGHLVVLWIDPDLCQRVKESPSAVDALTAVIASAVAQVSGHALAELKLLPREHDARRSTAYRGRL